jgi:adenylate cyclase
VNVYLATIADQIKKRDGTLDKYIGDCVMAFWGAPLPNERHAVDCVKTAMDAQRAMYSLNLRRAEQNKQREAENPARIAAGQPPLEMLPLLSLGTGINSGIAIVGLMGSSEHIISYTVFGREVNLASRLEGVSGRGRIIIGESTYLDLKKYEPQLAAIAVELAPVQVKGIKQAVKIYEVPWKPASIPNPAAPEAPKPEPAKAEPTPAGVAAPSTPKPVGLDATTFVPKTEPAAPAAPAAASSPGQTKPVGLDAT